MIHKLKIRPEFFEAVLQDQKRVEIRKDDRGFKVGHYLLLQEWDPEQESYTGREVVRRITHIMKGFEGLQPRYVALSLADPKDRLEEETRALAAKIAEACSFTVGIGKQAFYRQLEMPQPQAYAYAKEVMSLNATATDAQEGMCAFLHKRPPRWRHQ
jgi:hypothetical protein